MHMRIANSSECYDSEIRDKIENAQITAKPNMMNPLLIPKIPGLLEKLSLKKVMEFKPPPKPFKFR